MKYYNIVDKRFNGFYDSDVHEDSIFKICQDTGETVINDGFFYISDDVWSVLLDKQSEGCELIFMNGELIAYEMPRCDDSIVKPVFNYDSGEWIETATQEEVDSHWFREDVKFYNAELEFASKAVAELKCEIISEEDFEDVKLYMRSIDPHSPAKLTKGAQAPRPEIFKRYT